MTAFDRAWEVVKANPVWYSVHFTPRTEQEVERIWELQEDLAGRGITFDTGGMVAVGAGRNWELDHSLKGATPDQVLQIVNQSGLKYEVEARHEETAVEGLNETWLRNNPQYDTEAMLNIQQQPPQPEEWDPTVVDVMPCPQCGAEAYIIREEEGNPERDSVACNECGYTDMEWGQGR